MLSFTQALAFKPDSVLSVLLQKQQLIGKIALTSFFNDENLTMYQAEKYHDNVCNTSENFHSIFKLKQLLNEGHINLADC